MQEQEFETVRAELLPLLERLLLAEHRAVFGQLRDRRWTPPLAYRWMRYENPNPAGQLLAASRRLASEWTAARRHPGWREAKRAFEAEEATLLEQAERLAAERGFPRATQ